MTAPGTGHSARDWWGTEDVSVQYRNTLALDHVWFRAEPGQVSAVVGGDGAGRTTLLRCLAGALAPTSGTVRRPAPLATGYLAAGSGIYPDLSVAENLAFRASAYRIPPETARQRSAELLARAGLDKVTGRLAGQLSGGMRQKLGVIAAMLHRPDLLVLDEPTTGVDPVSRADLWLLIARAAAGGAAVVLATSYLDEAERAHHVLVLDAGSELASGTADQIVAAMRGTLTVADTRPAGEAGRRAWRRAGRWRVWDPGPDPGRRRPRRRRGPARPPGRGHRRRARPRTGPRRCRTGVPMTKLAAQAVAVTRAFGHFVAVDQVDLEVRPGEVVGLLGANGAGKTTLIRLLLGLLRPTGGEIRLFGEPPSRRTRRRIGYVPQGLGLYDDLTPAENFAFSAAVFGQGSAAAVLPEPLRQYGTTVVGSLPLGIQRTAAFAEALAHRPDLLVLDEPTSGVDPLARARLWETVAGAAAAGAGVLVTTHYMDEAGECDRLVVMAAGRVVARGILPEIVGDAQVSVVESDAWAEAFGALEAAGLPAALVGRTLRVPGAAPDAVRRALGDLSATVTSAPATLEERFFQLTLSADTTQAQP